MREEESDWKTVHIPIRQGNGFQRQLLEQVDDLHFCRAGLCSVCEGRAGEGRVLTVWPASQMGPFDSLGLPINQGPQWISDKEFNDRYRMDNLTRLRALYNASLISRQQMLDQLGMMG